MASENLLKSGKKLVHKITCPNCWHIFVPEDILFVAKHPDLIGDTVAGENEYQRFLPTRFTVNGDAIDPKGLATADLACPRCHLSIPDAMLEVPPLFISFAGSPASGKSYFLATMIWELRRLFPRIGFTFTDADPVANIQIQTNEHTLFMNPSPDRPTEIPKTQTDDPRLHKNILIDNVPVRFPIPLQFTLWPAHDNLVCGEMGRMVVLYDNAGEDFLPSMEDSSSAVIHHLAKANILMMMFDPTQDVRFKSQCTSEDPQLKYGLRPGQEKDSIMVRQETLLRQLAVKMRTYLKIPQSQRVRKPLIIILPKFDVWSKLTDISIDQEPYDFDAKNTRFQINLSQIDENSNKLKKKLLTQPRPELVATAENLSEFIRYIPVSSLGHSPSLIKKDSHVFYGVLPRQIQPKWVTVPLLYVLCRWAHKTMGNIKCV